MDKARPCQRPWLGPALFSWKSLSVALEVSGRHLGDLFILWVQPSPSCLHLKPPEGGVLVPAQVGGQTRTAPPGCCLRM